MTGRVVAMGAAVFTVFASGVAVAATGFDGTDGRGNINACFTNSTGALRVINTVAGQHCKNTETALSWKQTSSPGGGYLQLAALDTNGPTTEPAALVENAGQ